MRKYPWSCSDGFCGAEDCNRCRPNNEYYQSFKNSEETENEKETIEDVLEHDDEKI